MLIFPVVSFETIFMKDIYNVNIDYQINEQLNEIVVIKQHIPIFYPEKMKRLGTFFIV